MPEADPFIGLSPFASRVISGVAGIISIYLPFTFPEVPFGVVGVIVYWPLRIDLSASWGRVDNLDSSGQKAPQR